MSYILTAIKQAEKERQRGKAPDVLTTPGDRPRPHPRKIPWFWLSVALLANAVIVALVWLWPESPPIPTASSVGPAQRPVPATASKDEVRSTPGLLSSTSPPRPKRTPAPVSVPEDAIVSETGSRPRPPVPIASTELPAAKTKPAQPTDAVTPGQRSVTTESAPPAVESPSVASIEVKPPVPRSSGEERAPALTSSHLSERARAPADTTTPIRLDRTVEPESHAGSASRTAKAEEEAAIETLRRLPDLKINVHVWNDDPRQRFVLINMRKYYEGTRLAQDGSLLEKITSDGVILVRDDKRVHLLHGF